MLQSMRSQRVTDNLEMNNNMWDLRALTRIKPTPLALGGEVLTSGLPWKSPVNIVKPLDCKL